MTYLVLARKGEGKGVFLMHTLTAGLVDTSADPSRIYITNEDVREHAFRAYLHGRGTSAAGRLFVRRTGGGAGFTWMRQFWRDRGLDRLAIKVGVEEATGYVHYEADASRYKVTYHVNEASDAFRAREWAKFSPEAEWALRTDRHRHDDVYVYAQDEGLLDKTFLKLFNVVIRVTKSHGRLFCGVQGRREFVARYYWNLDRIGGAFKTERIGWNPELMNCYRTDSLGGGKRGAEGDKIKGIPFWLGVSGATALFALAIGGLWFVAAHGGAFAVRRMFGEADKVVAATKLELPAKVVPAAPVVARDRFSDLGKRVEETSVLRQGASASIVDMSPRPSRPFLLGWATVGSHLYLKTTGGLLVAPPGSKILGDAVVWPNGRWRLFRVWEGSGIDLPEGWLWDAEKLERRRVEAKGSDKAPARVEPWNLRSRSR